MSAPYKTRRGAVVSSGETSAGCIPVANAAGRIDPSWIDNGSAASQRLSSGSAIAPASGADQTDVAVVFADAFNTAPRVAILVTSGAIAGSGALVSYLNAPATTTGFHAYFDLAEGAGSPSTIDVDVHFDWIAVGT